jgi:hypothetical protein
MDLIFADKLNQDSFINSREHSLIDVSMKTTRPKSYQEYSNQWVERQQLQYSLAPTTSSLQLIGFESPIAPPGMYFCSMRLMASLIKSLFRI